MTTEKTALSAEEGEENMGPLMKVRRSSNEVTAAFVATTGATATTPPLTGATSEGGNGLPPIPKAAQQNPAPATDTGKVPAAGPAAGAQVFDNTPAPPPLSVMKTSLPGIAKPGEKAPQPNHSAPQQIAGKRVSIVADNKTVPNSGVARRRSSATGAKVSNAMLDDYDMFLDEGDDKGNHSGNNSATRRRSSVEAAGQQQQQQQKKPAPLGFRMVLPNNGGEGGSENDKPAKPRRGSDGTTLAYSYFGGQSATRRESEDANAGDDGEPRLSRVDDLRPSQWAYVEKFTNALKQRIKEKQMEATLKRSARHASVFSNGDDKGLATSLFATSSGNGDGDGTGEDNNEEAVSEISVVRDEDGNELVAPTMSNLYNDSEFDYDYKYEPEASARPSDGGGGDADVDAIFEGSFHNLAQSVMPDRRLLMSPPLPGSASRPTSSGKPDSSIHSSVADTLRIGSDAGAPTSVSSEDAPEKASSGNSSPARSEERQDYKLPEAVRQQQQQQQRGYPQQHAQSPHTRNGVVHNGRPALTGPPPRGGVNGHHNHGNRQQYNQQQQQQQQFYYGNNGGGMQVMPPAHSPRHQGYNRYAAQQPTNTNQTMPYAQQQQSSSGGGGGDGRTLYDTEIRTTDINDFAHALDLAALNPRVRIMGTTKHPSPQPDIFNGPKLKKDHYRSTDFEKLFGYNALKSAPRVDSPVGLSDGRRDGKGVGLQRVEVVNPLKSGQRRKKK